MPLVLYNSLTRRKEPFEPLDPARVGVYVCGPTVYDEAHIGNARAVVAFDLLYRVLRHEYGDGHVTYVRNITDVEDKIMAAARASGQTIDQVTARTTAQFHADMAALGNLPPDIEPRATEYIKEMIALIERLIASGHAYSAEGHALFRVASYAKYGALSRRSRADMIAGARVEVAPYKEDPGDFVLWKPSTPDQPGWDSPWGRGRPGWHIECSAMSENTLGETFDIHGGGLDLIFPHHENEIAQSVCAHAGRPFARYWLHNGMLTVGGAKMAKSEGNFITVRDALSQAPGEVIRLALLGTHYRAPLDWTEDRLHEARQTLDRLYRALALKIDGKVDHDRAAKQASSIIAALEDDLNVPLALSELHAETVAINRYHQSMPDDCVTGQEVLRTCGRLLGILEDDPTGWLQTVSTINTNLQVTKNVDLATRTSVNVSLGMTVHRISPEERAHIEERIEVRTLARKERRFADADRVRAELLAEGIVLEDKPDGTTDWRRA
ncbi:MAG TPA: cysteine--tRNA ligase [Stellaceae bacterium]|nr:cysteine--tRNA ligase [Stellaceae bacterium]